MPIFKNRTYSLRKSRHVLKWANDWYKKKGYTLPPHQLSFLEDRLEKLDHALLSQNKELASDLAKELEDFGKDKFKKSMFEYSSELFFAVAFALIVATLVRQMWFEPMEIPTGSMRPTFKEQDHLIASKLPFGINQPLSTDHLYFDPSLLHRTGIVIWSGDNIPLPDTDTTYFGIFPYKKRYVKRLMAKPGDIVYFYGGKLYILDKEGKFREELLTADWMKNIESIPFIRFEGDEILNGQKEIVFKQMYLPLAKANFNIFGETSGKIYNGKEWVNDDPLAINNSHDSIKSYADFWGIKNYAMARLLTKEQLQKNGQLPKNMETTPLYLELRHTPNLTYPKPILYQTDYGNRMMIPGMTTIIPLNNEHIKAIMDNMYTARFDVKNGLAKRYSYESRDYNPSINPSFNNLEDGRYEFYYGDAYKIGFGAIEYKLPKTNPIYSYDPHYVQKLFNLGIDFNKAYEPSSAYTLAVPHRYAYYRNGDLYLLGAPILKKDDPVLQQFVKTEVEKAAQSSKERPYVAFIDHGSPVKNGQIDATFMKSFGLKIPEKQYLVLGDNHAMSADSRVFGFLPEANLQGAPAVILWPPGARFGFLPQHPYAIFVTPRLIIWGLVLLILALWYIIHKRRTSRPLFKKIKPEGNKAFKLPS
ncbi:MAG: signal peptidase I [Chlamydia sp. 32-24]|nr:MAG: signal peptidase I [Chlamydia sp. 32-24]